MEKKKGLYLKLFMSTFYLSAFTFGGGFVIVALMRKEFVNKYKWIDDKEMLDLIAIAQSAPGPVAVNTSILMGYKMAGIRGAIVTVLGTISPPIIILSLISLAYLGFKDNRVITLILKGMQIGVAVVIVDVVISLIMDLLKENKIIRMIMFIAVFIAVYFFGVNIIFIILISGLLGFLYNRNRKKD